MTDITDTKALRDAATKYTKSLEAHIKTPLDPDLVRAMDSAFWELTDLIGNNELSIIINLLDQLEAERHKVNLWFGKVADLEAALKAERQRVEALQSKDPETGFDSLKNLKFVADCCIENPDSIYASEFFLLLDEMFGKQGDYSMPVQAVAVSHLIGLLEAERQRADDCDKSAKYSAATNKSVVAANCRLQEEIAAMKGEQVPVAYTAECEISNMKATGLYLRAWPDDLRDSYNIPLYDRPQKPIVLPIDEMSYKDACEFVSINGMRNEDRPTLAMKVWNSCRKSAIEAAGGIVKDGE